MEQLGDELYEALCEQRTLAPLTEREAGISIEDAYHISQRMVARRVQAGEHIVGKKIGVTSAPVQEMLGVFQPDFGFLTSGMVFEDGADISIAEHLIQPRAEGEIAFRLKSDLRGPGVTEEEVLNATEVIIPCFEIVDSRIRDWQGSSRRTRRSTCGGRPAPSARGPESSSRSRGCTRGAGRGGNRRSLSGRTRHRAPADHGGHLK